MCAVNMAERFYTIDELADILKLNRNTVKKYIELGELIAVQIGSQYRISESDLQRYIESKRTDREKRQK